MSRVNVVHELVAPRPVWRLTKLAIASEMAEVTPPMAAPSWRMPDMSGHPLYWLSKVGADRKGRVSETSTDDG
jgi:hypothetical protein